MGLKVSLIIVKGCNIENYNQLVFDLGFNIKTKLGEFDLMSVSSLEKNQIAVGQINGLVYIAHCDLPTFVIDGELTQRNYDESKEFIDNQSERYVAAILQSTTNLFGYGINVSGFLERAIIGNFEGIFNEYGSLQEEEKFLKSNLNKETNKIFYNNSDYELHEIGEELTINVLNNFCEGDFIKNELIMNLFEVSILNNRRLTQSAEGAMKYLGYSDEDVVKLTGLDLEDVKEIRTKIKI